MANAKIRKILSLVFVQFGLLMAMTLQLYGMIIAYKLLETRRIMLLSTYLSTKKSKWFRKRKRLQVRSLCRKPRTTWVVNGRTDLWWSNMVRGNVPDSCWKRSFRMSRDCFYSLVADLDPIIGPHLSTPNYRFITTDKKLAITLYYIKDTGSLWMTANSFGIHQCTVSKTVAEVCKAINTVLGPKYIHLPNSQDEMREKVSEFELRFGMIQAFGCIDGTHVALKRPPANSQDYFNYKQFFSLNIQAVCDSKGYFMDVECRWPGSVHDAKVFANATICNKLNRGKLPQTFRSVLPGYDVVSNYLIGDPAYPLTQFCLKEYQTCSENKQVIFNSMLRSARNQIECAFGRLKARWGFLRRKVDIKFEMIPLVAYSCFVLHNYCESVQHCGLDEDVVETLVLQQRTEEENMPNNPDTIYSINNHQGEYVRSILTDYIEQNLPDNY